MSSFISSTAVSGNDTLKGVARRVALGGKVAMTQNEILWGTVSVFISIFAGVTHPIIQPLKVVFSQSHLPPRADRRHRGDTYMSVSH